METAKVNPVWTNEQLGLEDGTAPRMLAEGEKMPLGKEAMKAAETRLSELIGDVKTKLPVGVKVEAAPIPHAKKEKEDMVPIVAYRLAKKPAQKMAAMVDVEAFVTSATATASRV